MREGGLLERDEQHGEPNALPPAPGLLPPRAHRLAATVWGASRDEPLAMERNLRHLHWGYAPA